MVVEILTCKNCIRFKAWRQFGSLWTWTIIQLDTFRTSELNAEALEICQRKHYVRWNLWFTAIVMSNEFWLTLSNHRCEAANINTNIIYLYYKALNSEWVHTSKAKMLKTISCISFFFAIIIWPPARNVIPNILIDCST